MIGGAFCFYKNPSTASKYFLTMRKIEEMTMNESGMSGMGSASLSTVIGAAIGIAVFILATLLIPKLVERFSTHIDEQKEIARGNQAVAEYYGRIVSACILGVSIIIAAAVYAGLQ
jgi:hypothetical protein